MMTFRKILLWEKKSDTKFLWNILSKYFCNTLYIQCERSLWLYECMNRHDKERDVTRMHPVYAKASRTWGETLIERRCLATGVLATFFLLLTLLASLLLTPSLSLSFYLVATPFWLPFIPLLRSLDVTVSISVKANDAPANSRRTSPLYVQTIRIHRINDILIDGLVSIVKWLIRNPLDILY